LNKTSTIFNNNYLTNLKTVKRPSIKNKINYNTEEVNKSDNEFDDEDDIIISNKKELNQMSENNESYMFFYTDQNYYNYIINLFSYRIKIEHLKLNPKMNWEFHLNFKQMRYLNEVSKYEDLLTFLPKIIITNYEIGELDINFDIFYNNFNAKILQNESGQNKNKKKQLKIDVFKPHIESEKIGGKEEKKMEKEFCKENYLNDKALSKGMEIFKQLIGYLKKMKINEYKYDKEKEIQDKIEKIDKYLDRLKRIGVDNNENKNKLIINCLLTGYFNNIAKYSNDNFFNTIKGNQLCKIHPIISFN